MSKYKIGDSFTMTNSQSVLTIVNERNVAGNMSYWCEFVSPKGNAFISTYTEGMIDAYIGSGSFKVKPKIVRKYFNVYNYNKGTYFTGSALYESTEDATVGISAYANDTTIEFVMTSFVDIEE